MINKEFKYSCACILEKNQEFLNTLFFRTLGEQQLRDLFPSNPQKLSILVLYVQEDTLVQSSQAVLIQCCSICIDECSLRGHVFLSGHDYFIFLLENNANCPEQELARQFELIKGNLYEQYGFQVQHFSNEVCRIDTYTGNWIQSALTSVCSNRYYGNVPEGLELHSVSTLQLQKLLDNIEKHCELGNVAEATNVLRKFVRSVHSGYYHPMNLKRSTLRGMYAFFSVRNFRGDRPYYDIPHFITEQLLKADTYIKTEQVMESFFTYIIRSENLTARTVSEPMQNALQFIHENYQDPIKLSEVAEAVYLNKSYLSQLFQKTMGVTYSEYLEDLRIQAAKHFLKTTTKTASEIAELVGFSSQNYFTKVFRSAVGISPIRYRHNKVS